MFDFYSHFYNLYYVFFQKVFVKKYKKVLVYIIPIIPDAQEKQHIYK